MAKKKVEENGWLPEALKLEHALAPVDPQSEERWPNLLQCLTPRFEGRLQKWKGATLRIRPQGCVWILTLDLLTAGLETSLECPTLLEAFDALEALLRSGKTVWRLDYESAKKARQADKKML